ncbi:MAG TPA: glycerol-3-phosphate acyltransferase [Terriglobia bacterium]|nr:glycerol-3-phosphate acyltransferase [Terriglobia bacterium]
MLVRCVICFLLGSIPFAVLSMVGSGVDIRKIGSGNPGFNNVLRVSKGRAMIALIGDMGKGLLALWIVLRVWPMVLPHGIGAGVAAGWLFGFVTVLGHCYSPFLKFSGGKGIATSAGVMLMLYPEWAAVGLIFFVILRMTGSKWKWREAGALASLATWILFVILMLIFVGKMDALYAATMTLFLVYRHQKNIRNLLMAPSRGGSGAHER